MSLAPPARKLLLAVHLTVATGWIGAVVAFIALIVTATRSDAERTLVSTWLAMETIGTNAIVPLALASLVTGIALALGTRWGLFRHYWVTTSLLLTVVAVLVLLSNMSTVRHYAGLAAAPSPDTAALRRGLPTELVHSGLGLVVLVVVQILNVYKPRGLTRFGWRRGRHVGAGHDVGRERGGDRH